MRTIYLESFAGLAGDMFTAAFLDAGLVDPAEIEAVPGLLGAPDVTVEITDTIRANARFTKVTVVLPDGSVEGRDHHHGGDSPSGDSQGGEHHHHVGHDGDEHDHGGKAGHGGGHHHHHYTALVTQIEESDLGQVAKDFALRVFRLLAEAEAHSHGVPVEKVAFHEVGAVDSIVDVAMAGVCVAKVAADRITASPIKLGRGTIRIQHGTYPVPPPASARLAVGMPVSPVPDSISRPNVELSTPTGLAILKALEPEFLEGWPSGTLLAQGSGAGTTDLGDYPNVFRVAYFDEAPGGGDPGGGDPASDASEGSAEAFPFESDTVVEVRCNVDDQSAERTAWLMEKALEHGALDGWVTQVVGKKGRPAVCMSFLVKPEDVTGISRYLLLHSSTFGVRYAPWGRFKLAREEEVRETSAGPVTFKVGMTSDGKRVKEKPEFEDLKKIWEEDPDFMP